MEEKIKSSDGKKIVEIKLTPAELFTMKEALDNYHYFLKQITPQSPTAIENKKNAELMKNKTKEIWEKL